MTVKVTPKYRGTKFYNEATRLLIQAARSKTFVNYTPLFEILNLKPGNHASSEAGQLLGEISEDTHRAGLPMLSAVVVRTTDRRPGDGFFVLAQTLGKIAAGNSGSQREAFWRREVERVYTANWGTFETQLATGKRESQHKT